MNNSCSTFKVNIPVGTCKIRSSSDFYSLSIQILSLISADFIIPTDISIPQASHKREKIYTHPHINFNIIPVFKHFQIAKKSES